MGSWGFENDPQGDSAICGRYQERPTEMQREYQTLVQRYMRISTSIDAQERTIADTERQIRQLPNLPAPEPTRGRNRRRSALTDIIGAIAETNISSTARSLESRLKNQKSGLERLMRQLEAAGEVRDRKFESMYNTLQKARAAGCNLDIRL